MIVTRQIRLQTHGNNDVHDLTPEVARHVAESGVRSGVVTVFVTGSTAGVTTVEYEPALVGDLREFLDQLVPAQRPYRHNQTWGDANAHSHLRSSLIGTSLTVPFDNGRLLLGTWQQIVLVDFDVRPRSREVVLQIVGE